jgi:hypothetical protein
MQRVGTALGKHAPITRFSSTPVSYFPLLSTLFDVITDLVVVGKGGVARLFKRASRSPNILISVTAIGSVSSAKHKDMQGCIFAGRR